MTAAGPTERGSGAAPGVGKANERPVAESPQAWLLRQKTAVPDRVAGYLDRAELVSRIMPTRRRVTVLKAPGGFGKTTLLAECCRRLSEEGVPTAWVSLDERDGPEALAASIAFACQSAGPDLHDEAEADKTKGVPGSGAALVARAIEALGRPFVLALDEPDRLKNPASVALLDFLLHRGPPNLHMALACRELPNDMNIAGAVLAGHATVVTSDELRFDKPEIATFFDLRLSRSELDSVVADTAGWPFALRVARNRTESATREGTRTVLDFVENWVETRLFEGLEADDRDFLLDIGLFEWMDAALLDDVLQRNDSMRRIDTIPVLAGLLEPIPGEAPDAWRLHPLIRDHCVRRRFRETPQRFCSIHRRIAGALSRRGETVAAMRHAVAGGDPDLAGDILEHAGGVRLQLRQGLDRFMAADRLLSEDVISKRPRLALVRCLALVLSGHTEEARKRHAAVAATLPTRDGERSEEEFELSLDDCILRGNIVLYGGEGIGTEWVRALLPDLSRFAKSPRIDPPTRGHMEFVLCIGHHLTAQFETALDHAVRARQYLGESRHMTMLIDLEVGQIAMAQGRVHDAETHYGQARQAPKTGHELDAVPAATARILLHELALECNRQTPVADLPQVPGTLATNAGSFSAHAAASGAAVDLRLRDGDVGGALEAVDEMLESVRGAGAPAYIRYMSALRVSLLAMAARIEDADRAWRLDDLPEAPEGCLDLAGQSWREMEALSCAHLRLLIARERFDEGRSFAGELRATTAARGLRRTLMRALPLSMVLERRAGNEDAVVAHLEEYLRVFVETPYAGPFARERDVCAGVVASYLDAVPASPFRETAQSLVEALGRVVNAPNVALSGRETQVLQLLRRQRDKQIAAVLGLTTHGVRYHLRSLFSKLGARTRADAVRRAKKLGLVQDEP